MLPFILLTIVLILAMFIFAWLSPSIFINASRPKKSVSPAQEKEEDTSIEQVQEDDADQVIRDYICHVCSMPSLFDGGYDQEVIDNRIEHASRVILPPAEWSITGSSRSVFVDGDWLFPLSEKSEEPWELYIYSVKGFENLIKVGIAKNVVKRKEKYYGRCLRKYQLAKRDAVLAECMFKHATFHLAHSGPPKWNVGNHQEDDLLPSLKSFYDAFPYGKHSGQTEVREITFEQAVHTLLQLMSDQNRICVDQMVLKYGIKTFGLSNVRSGSGGLKVPHRKWYLKGSLDCHGSKDYWDYSLLPPLPGK